MASIVQKLNEPRDYVTQEDIGYRGNMLNGMFSLGEIILAFVVGALVMNFRDWNPGVSAGAYVALALLAIGMIAIGYTFIYAFIAKWKRWATIPLVLLVFVVGGLTAITLYVADVDMAHVLVSFTLCIIVGGLLAGTVITRWLRIKWSDNRPSQS